MAAAISTSKFFIPHISLWKFETVLLGILKILQHFSFHSGLCLKDVILPDMKFSSIIASAAQSIVSSVAIRQKIRKGVTVQFSEKARQKS